MRVSILRTCIAWRRLAMPSSAELSSPDWTKRKEKNGYGSDDGVNPRLGLILR